MSWLGFDPDTQVATRTRVLVVLVLAVIAISSSAVLVRAMVAPALAIAAWRTLGAGLLLAVPGFPGRRQVTPRDALGIAIAGIALGLHFWAWFASVQLTTILRSTLLVALVPAWTALFEWIVDGRPPTRNHWLGLVVALPGLALLASTGGGGSASLVGDACAVLASVLWAVYFLIGRRVRQRVSITTYMGLVCAAACAVLFPAALGLGVPLTGFPTATWGFLAAAVLGPQLVGHQGFAYAVKWVPATTISTLMLLEPVGASVLAALVYGEVPGPAAWAGSLLVLLGIGVATRPAASPG